MLRNPHGIAYYTDMGFSLTTAFEEPKVPSAFVCLVGRSERPKVTGVPSCLVILSTKYWDEDSKLAYYGYRYYSPGMGRWASRDPIGEKGGLNQHSAFLSDAVNKFDPWGNVVVFTQDKTDLYGNRSAPNWYTFKDGSKADAFTDFKMDHAYDYDYFWPFGKLSNFKSIGVAKITVGADVTSSSSPSALENLLLHEQSHVNKGLENLQKYDELASHLFTDMWECYNCTEAKVNYDLDLLIYYKLKDARDGADYDCNVYPKGDPKNERCVDLTHAQEEVDKQYKKLIESFKNLNASCGDGFGIEQ